jgi:hypothetical protein
MAGSGRHRGRHLLFTFVVMPLVVLIFGGAGAFMLYQGVPPLIAGARSISYIAADGTMTVSRVHSGGADADLAYEFVVAGRSYQGRRYSYDVELDTEAAERARFATAHPAGTRVTIYHDPQEPTRCVLIPGIRTGASFLPVFAIPSVAIALAMLALTVQAAAHGPGAAGGRLIERPGLLILRRASGAGFAAGVTFLTSIVLSVVWGFWVCFIGPVQAAWPAAAIGSIVLVGGRGAGVAGWVFSGRGRFDIVVDREQNLLFPARNWGAVAPAPIPIEQIESIEVRKVEKQARAGLLRLVAEFLHLDVPTIRSQSDAAPGPRREEHMLPASSVMVAWNDAGGAHEVEIAWFAQDPQQAAELRDWLVEQCGAPTATVAGAAS